MEYDEHDDYIEPLLCRECYKNMERAFCLTVGFHPLCEEHCSCDDKEEGDYFVEVTVSRKDNGVIHGGMSTTLHDYARSVVQE